MALLFDASVGENILLGRADATPPEIAAAARAAGAHEFIRRLPEGYSTRVGQVVWLDRGEIVPPGDQLSAATPAPPPGSGAPAGAT